MSYCFVDEQGNTRICDVLEDNWARGRCSGIPECCIMWYTGCVIPALYAGFTINDPVEWGYRPCPTCVSSGNRVTVLSCARENGQGCTCGTFKNSRIVSEAELEAEGFAVHGDEFAIEKYSISGKVMGEDATVEVNRSTHDVREEPLTEWTSLVVSTFNHGDISSVHVSIRDADEGGDLFHACEETYAEAISELCYHHRNPIAVLERKYTEATGKEPHEP